MSVRNWSIFGLALVLAFTLTASVPGGAQAQQNSPAVASQGYDTGYYDYNGSGYAYCPMGPGYGYSAPVKRDYRNSDSSTWGRGYQGAWCPWNSGYARGYRSGGGYCW